MQNRPRLNIQYQYQEAFWLLGLVLLLAVLFILYLQWKKKIIRHIGDEALVKTLIKNHSSRKEILKATLVLVAFVLGCIALANPRRPDKSVADERAGIDVIIALDVSNSMLATDVPPVRLQRAQQFLIKAIDKMPNDRVGLILFAGNAYVQMPLSTDHDAAKMFVSTADPDAVPEQGTAIGEALDKADIILEESDRFKTVILVTDGETHDEDALDLAKKLAKKGVMINTIGIGSPGGSTIIDTATRSAKKDEDGNVIMSKLNEQLLQQLAFTTNGTYIHLQNADEGVTALLQQYANVEKKALPDQGSMVYQSFYWWLVLPMLLLLLLEIFIPDRKRVKE